MISETPREHLERGQRELAIKSERSIDCNISQEEVRHAN